jgi:hypothetical protein
MAIHYNQKATLVTNSMIDSVTTNLITTTVNGDVGGAYQFRGIIDSPGCGQPPSSVSIRIKDTIPWTKMTCYFEMDGTASCWDFNQSNGNMQTYNESLGDRIFRDTNAFSSNSNFVKKLFACDNENTNFFHNSFATGGANSIKSFWVTTRRTINGNLSGPYHYRSCNTTGRYILITNIFIF